MTYNKPKLFYISSTSLLIVIFDQITKLLISSYFLLGESKVLINNVVSLTLIQNTGAGFGILKGFNIFLIIISLLIIGAIFYCYKKIPERKYMYVAVGLLLGGAVGNLIDRILYGYVVDFINFGWWPAFNVADSAITVGVVLLGIEILRDRNSNKKSQQDL